MNWYPLKVLSKIRQTKAAYLITIEIPSEIKHDFLFKPGQFITVSCKNKENLRIPRCYSICSSVNDESISFCVKHIKGGLVSTQLCEELVAGDFLYVKKPQGNFVISPNQKDKAALFVAVGSGITPIKAMILSLLANNHRKPITLIYANRNEENIIFFDFFKNISNRKNINIIFFNKETPENTKGIKGRLNNEKLSYILENNKLLFKDQLYYICAPENFILNTTLLLKKKESVNLLYILNYISQQKKRRQTNTQKKLLK